MFRLDPYTRPGIIGLIDEGSSRESEPVDNDDRLALRVFIDQSELDYYFAHLRVWMVETSLVDMKKLLRSDHNNVSVHLGMHVNSPVVA